MSDKSSCGSSHSLCSRGNIGVASIAVGGTTRKAPAVWLKAEETTFLEFLVLVFPSSGDGGFKMPTFNQASTHLNAKYPHQRGAEKSGIVCKNKWTALKKSYQSIVEINGAGITDRKDDVWACFTKAHPHAKPFMMKGFDYFETMEQLMPTKSKGSHIHRGTKATATTSNTTPLDPIPSSIPPARLGHMFHPPSSLLPLKALLLTPHGQVLAVESEGTETMKSLIEVVPEMQKSLVLVPQLPVQPSTHVGRAVSLLNTCVELTSKERLAIANFLAEHENQAIIFYSLDEVTRAEWLEEK
ncbi:hypothetical protein BDR07DRAFT_1381594 [Suillus spraguei]|nr:hypothetical protein BDR07DRAFT_1381594 [Suillus spraguei]